MPFENSLELISSLRIYEVRANREHEKSWSIDEAPVTKLAVNCVKKAPALVASNAPTAMLSHCEASGLAAVE